MKNTDLLELTYFNSLVLLLTQNQLLLVSWRKTNNNVYIDPNTVLSNVARCTVFVYKSIIYRHTYLFSLELRASVGEGNASTTPGNGRVSSSSSNMIQSSETL